MADLKNWDDCYREWMSRSAIAQWNFETDMTEENKNLVNRHLKLVMFFFCYDCGTVGQTCSVRVLIMRYNN